MRVHEVIDVEALPWEEEALDEGVGLRPLHPIFLIGGFAPEREVLRGALESKRYRVRESADCREGLRLFQRRASLTIVDLAMPENDVIALMKAMLTFDSDAVIFTMSGTDDARDHNEVARTMGAKREFRKPINASDLLVAIGKCSR